MKKNLLFVFLMMLLAVTSAFGDTAYRYSDTVSNIRGDVIGGATVTVYAANTTTKVDLYKYNTTTSTELANPTSTDTYGRFYFYTAPGLYDVVISGTGITEYTVEDIRIWSDINDGVYHVSDYGATGDGVADDTDAIDATLDAAASNGGGVIVFPSGEFLYDGMYVLSGVDGISIIGAGKGVTKIIEATDSGLSPSILPAGTLGYFLRIQNCTDVGITGISFFGKYPNYYTDQTIRHGVYIRDCSDVIIDDCSFSGWNYGLSIWYQCHDVEVRNSDAYNCGYWGLGSFGSNSTVRNRNVSFINCVARDCKAAKAEGPYQVTTAVDADGFISTDLLQTNPYGYDDDSTYDNWVVYFTTGAVADEAGTVGTYTAASQTINGLFPDMSIAPSIGDDFWITPFYGDGIAIQETIGGTISGCKVFNNAIGIRIEECSGLTITGNTAYDNNRTGIKLYIDTIGCRVSDNNTYNNNQFIWDFSDTSGSDINNALTTACGIQLEVRCIGNTIASNTAINTPRQIATKAKHYSSGSYIDMTEATDRTAGASDDYNLVYLAGDYVYIGHHNRFNNLFFDLGVKNDVVSTMTLEYWDGDAWIEPDSLTDNTSSGGISLGVEDDVNWPRSQNMAKSDVDGDNMYWCRLSWNVDLRAGSIDIYDIYIDASTSQHIGIGANVTMRSVSTDRSNGNWINNNVTSGNDIDYYMEETIQANPEDRAGTGSPEGVVTAQVGSTYHRTDGGAGTSIYVKESGTGNTGWAAVSTTISASPKFHQTWVLPVTNAPANESFMGGFYDFAASASTFPTGSPVSFGNADNSYAAHFMVVLGATATDEITLTITGDSITDDSIVALLDTDTITIPNGSLADAYFETDKKWLGAITIETTAGTAKTCDYGWCKYWDNGNTDFTVVGGEAVWMGDYTGQTINIELIHHKATGWTYTGTGPTPPTPLFSMADAHGTNVEITSDKYGCFKRSGGSFAIDGDGSEGVIVKFTQSQASCLEYGQLTLQYEQ